MRFDCACCSGSREATDVSWATAVNSSTLYTCYEPTRLVSTSLLAFCCKKGTSIRLCAMDSQPLLETTPVSFAPTYQAPPNDSGPFPDLQGMSPTLPSASEEHRQTGQGFLQGTINLGSQLPVGYGATTTPPVMNGTGASSGSTGALLAGSAGVAARGSLGATQGTRADVVRTTGPVVTRVSGSLEQLYADTPAPATISLAPADMQSTVQQQLPVGPLQLRTQQTTQPTASASGDTGDVEPSAGSRISLEPSRAMSQPAAQRTALVHALQQRAVRASSAFTVLEGEGATTTAIRPATEPPLEDPHGEVVWYSRLQGFLRRRVIDPVREQVEHLRRSPLNPSPQSAWYSTSPAPSESLMDVQTRRAVREWTEQGSSLLPGPQRPMQVDGITEEDVQDEVRRQIAAALENRDQQFRELQSENGELRQLLRAVVEGGDMLERVADTRQCFEREGQPGPGALEDPGNLGGVRNNYVLRQKELPRAPALPGFESQALKPTAPVRRQMPRANLSGLLLLRQDQVRQLHHLLWLRLDKKLSWQPWLSPCQRHPLGHRSNRPWTHMP